MHLRRPSRRLLVPAVVVAGALAVVTAAAPHLVAGHTAAHSARHTAALVPRDGGGAAGTQGDAGAATAAGTASGRGLASALGLASGHHLHSSHVPPSAPTGSQLARAGLLTIASLRALRHEATTGPVVPIGPSQPEHGYSLQRVAYQSQGLRVTASLLIPTTPGRHPLVLALHGLASPRTYVPGGDVMGLAVPLARAGALVCLPDYRGLGGSAPDPRTEPVPTGDAIDALNLLDILLRDPRVDPDRVAVLGHSLGGNVGEIVLAAHTGIRAALLYAPAESDDDALYLRRPNYFHGRGGVGTPQQDPTLYREMSPGSNFDPLRCNVLLEQGTADPVVPPHASVIAADEMKAAGADVHLTMVPGATHDLGEAQWTAGRDEGTAFLVEQLGLTTT